MEFVGNPLFLNFDFLPSKHSRNQVTVITKSQTQYLHMQNKDWNIHALNSLLLQPLMIISQSQ